MLVIGAGIVAFSNAAAQVSPPSASDVSPTVNTDVSSLIHTGSGYDAWTGSVRRQITDLEVPGAVSSLGLKWVRTYNSGSSSLAGGWSFSWTWRYWGRGWGDDPNAVHLPDGGIWRTTKPGMKLRFIKNDPDPIKGCPNHDPANSCANLYLEDGSRVYMDRWTDLPDDHRNYPIDHYTPEYVDDPYGRRTTLDYEQPCIGNGYQDGLIRLKQVTDPSGRFIRIRYACGVDDCQHCNTSNWWQITRVEGSDGSWVSYSDPNHDVVYSDGTYADYTYGDTTYLFHNPCCNWPQCVLCWETAHATKLITANDTHADSPMQSIRYDYATADSGNKWEGAIATERHLASNVAVSTLISNSTPGADSATQRETRGDGPSRTLYIQKDSNYHVPLVKRKSDFNGINEVYT